MSWFFEHLFSICWWLIALACFIYGTRVIGRRWIKFHDSKKARKSDWSWAHSPYDSWKMSWRMWRLGWLAGHFAALTVASVCFPITAVLLFLYRLFRAGVNDELTAREQLALAKIRERKVAQEQSAQRAELEEIFRENNWDTALIADVLNPSSSR